MAKGHRAANYNYDRATPEQLGIVCEHVDRARLGRGLCKPCYHRWRWHAEPGVKERHARHHIRRKYAVTPEDVKAILTFQGGCATCHTVEGKFHIDHDHDTGLVRGLLCHRCNLLQGFIQKTTHIVLERMMRYTYGVGQSI